MKVAESCALAEQIGAAALIDQHVHGCWLRAGDRGRFENALNEANTKASTDSGFDSQIGFAVRAYCAPILGLSKHAEPQDYWERRSEFSERDLAGLFLRAARVSDWLVDTGIGSDLAGVSELGELSGDRAHEVVRLEQVAEQAAHASGDYASTFREILHRRAAGAVGTKSILAYRGGFDGDLTEPPAAQVAEAASRWRDRGGTRLDDRVLLRFGLHEALRVGKPLQLHVGFGDRDCDLHKSNPLYLLDFLQQSNDIPIVLLHCYPYEREAGYLAQAFNNVYLDGGLSVNYLGARAPSFIARLLEMAPFRKILYSSDGFGPAELHFLGAALWRNGIHRVLRGFVDSDEWSEADAVRVVDLIAHGNAARIYRLGAAAG
ncbi:amidohydrolase family protein [Mycobacterium shigaense]|uniref:amidohydrolase family protein n=1 Tax=Mycobacterium shigaense TaxID=722731 RepID=UPI000BBB4E87|nr:amidohydrolase family protein [Mycobacterium shigaense]MEA1123552.1 amidohydrolase family protein [Mycobacterium shigaense]PRI13692.1 amidohydrolase [Mycobacterium shigaense]